MQTKPANKSMEYARGSIGTGPLVSEVVTRFAARKVSAGVSQEIDDFRAEIKAGREFRDDAFSKDEADALIMLAHFKNQCINWLNRNGQKT